MAFAFALFSCFFSGAMRVFFPHFISPWPVLLKRGEIEQCSGHFASRRGQPTTVLYVRIRDSEQQKTVNSYCCYGDQIKQIKILLFLNLER